MPGSAPPYQPAPPYEPPASFGGPTPYGQAPYAPAPYDTGVTQVFRDGLLGDGQHAGSVPAYDDDFARSATARIDFGPHEAFGPPPEEAEPEPEPDAAHVFDRLRRIRSHARQKRKRRRGWVGVVVVLVLFAAAGALRFVPASPFYPYGAVEESPAAATMPFHDATITAEELGVDGFLSWAYQDLRDDADAALVGAANMTETTDSTTMLAAWLGADLLSRSVEAGQDPGDTDLADVEAMIQRDDLDATARVLTTLGGYTESISRLRAICNLTDTESVTESWQQTAISARDAARMGACLADGRAAGAEWTPWLLNVMRQVQEPGDFGIPYAFSPDERAGIAIKNGMLLDEEDGQWRVNCLAIGDTWALAVLQRFPDTGDPNTDLARADSVCQQVVTRLLG